MIAPCRMDGKHCLDCGRVHFGKALEYSQGTDERSVAIRRLWRDGGTTPHPPKPILRSLPLAKQCSNNTGENGRAKAGCTTCATYGCNVHGTVRLSQCVYCEDYQKPPLTMFGEMEMWQNAYQEKNYTESRAFMACPQPLQRPEQASALPHLATQDACRNVATKSRSAQAAVAAIHWKADHCSSNQW